jgi:hypothetical protein
MWRKLGIAVLVVLIGAGVAVAISSRDNDEGEEGEHFAENALREVAHEGAERREAAFRVEGEGEGEPGEEGDVEESGEAERGGPNSPSAQAVADRAYPRAYVDDRLALKTRRAFQRTPDV